MGRAILTLSGLMKRLREAALWRDRLEGDVAAKESPEFRKWHSEPRNRDAWNRVANVLHVIDRHRDAPEMLKLRTAAWRRAHSTPSVRVSPFWFFAAGGAAAVLIVVFGTTSFTPPQKPVVYATSVGDSRMVVLADGSRVRLDSASAIAVIQFSSKSRALELIKGRAHFDIMHDVRRPFSVRVGNERVIDIGTAFNVEKLRAKVLVTLTRGRVEVESEPSEGAAEPERYLLVPGQELVVNRTGNPALKQVDMAAANAWEHGQIVFNGEALGDAAERLNRYMIIPLKVDPAIAKTKINGVFNINKLDAFVAVVTSYFPIQAKQERGYILLEKRT